MIFSSKELRLFLKLLAEKHGPGYSDNPEIGTLQAKLSIMVELAERLEANRSE